MAGRSGMGVGLGVTVFALSVTTLGFGVAAAIFFSQFKDADRARKDAQNANVEIITPTEQNSDAIRGLAAAAKKSRKSLVSYLSEQYGTTMTKVTGRGADTPDTLATRLNDFPALKDGAKPVLAYLTDVESELRSVKDQLGKANEDRTTALTNLQAESERVKGIEENYKKTIASLGDQVERYRQQIEEYRNGVNDYKTQLDAKLSKADADHAAEKKKLSDQISKLVEESLTLGAQVKQLRGQASQQILKPADEYALVDGQVVGVDGSGRRAFLNIGAQQKVQIGMTFAVYADASAIKPDASGNYPRGKATLEVINVGPTSSTARVTSETRGNPVVNGDVIANAIFDPNKVYKVVIDGNFDTNHDTFATAQEKRQIEAMVKEWGAKVSDELGPEVDFLILGERPVMPPNPPDDAPVEVFQNFVAAENQVKRYDRLFDQAQRASIPILNENRFYTLIGRTGAR